MKGHHAFKVISMCENLNHRIECIDTFRQGNTDFIIVGTQEGNLIVYGLKIKNNTEELDVIFAKQFFKKPITQINVFQSLNIVITLCDSTLNIHNISDLKVIKSIRKSGASLFATDLMNNSIKIALAVKKKISILVWDGMNIEEKGDISIPDTAKLLLWAGKNLYTSIKKTYYQIDIQSGQVIEVISNGKSGIVAACLLPFDQILLQKDQIGIFMGWNNKSTREFGVGWSGIPSEVQFTFPYIISILPKCVEIRPVFESEALFCQTIDIPHVKCIAMKEKLRSGNIDDYRITAGNVFIASQRQIWKLVPIDFEKQVDMLIEDKEYENAHALATYIGQSYFKNGRDKLIYVEQMYSYKLFFDGKYVEAMKIFNQIQFDVIKVISLYPDMLPVHYQDINHPIALPKLNERNLFKALDALVEYLESKRTSMIELETYDQTMDQTDWDHTINPCVIIDTVLLMSYVKLKNRRKVEELLSGINFCHSQKSLDVLQSYHMYNEIILLNSSKGRHEESLKLLKSLGESNEDLEMKGPNPTIRYLSKLGVEHMPLIIKYSTWILAQYPQEGLAIFKAERSPKDRLPPDIVLSHLKKVFNEHIKDKMLKQRIIMDYLEYVVLETKDQSNDLNNELVYLYFDMVIELKSQLSIEIRKKNVPVGSEKGLLGELRMKLNNFLSKSNNYNPEKMLSKYDFPGYGLFKERAILYSKIGEHGRALEEYIHEMNDKEQAEQYCIQQFNDSESSKDVFLNLLQVLLTPIDDPTRRAENLDFAFTILEKYFDSINTAKALELFPDDTNLSQMYDFFQNVWRNINQNKRESQIVHNIRKCEGMKVKHELLKLRSRSIKITEETICPACNKKLGEAVFACFPDGELVHYRCYTSRQNYSNIPKYI